MLPQTGTTLPRWREGTIPRIIDRYRHQSEKAKSREVGHVRTGTQSPPTTVSTPAFPSGGSPTNIPPFPLSYHVDYPDRPLDRLSTALRFLWVIPIGVIAGLLGSGSISVEGTDTPGLGR